MCVHGADRAGPNKAAAALPVYRPADGAIEECLLARLTQLYHYFPILSTEKRTHVRSGATIFDSKRQEASYFDSFFINPQIFRKHASLNVCFRIRCCTVEIIMKPSAKRTGFRFARKKPKNKSAAWGRVPCCSGIGTPSFRRMKGAAQMCGSVLLRMEAKERSGRYASDPSAKRRAAYCMTRLS